MKILISRKGALRARSRKITEQNCILKEKKEGGIHHSLLFSSHEIIEDPMESKG